MSVCVIAVALRVPGDAEGFVVSSLIINKSFCETSKNLWSFSAGSFVLHLVWYVTHSGHIHTRHITTYARPDLHTPDAHPLLTVF